MTTRQNTMSLPSDADITGRSFGPDELAELTKVIESGTLNCTRGSAVPAFEAGFAEMLGVPHCRAVNSGTAAVHTAIAAIDLEPGDEIITTPITDMGAITPILYQAAIPVFADVDPATCNITAATIEPRITRRTKAVIVTHLFGAPCDMDPILELCQSRGLVLIEDAAQAYLAEYRGRQVGTMGLIGCFSMQQGKHLCTGEGGMVVCSDPDAHRRMRLFSDKAWGYGDPKPDHYFLALNYRMTELQGAVALAQLPRLGEFVSHRIEMAHLLSSLIRDVPGVQPPVEVTDARHTYWRYGLRVDSTLVRGGPDALGAQLKGAGIFCAPRYVQKPAFECEVLRDHKTFGTSEFPYQGAHRAGDPEVVYDRAGTPGAISGLDQLLVLPLNERFLPEHIHYIADEIHKGVEACR